MQATELSHVQWQCASKSKIVALAFVQEQFCHEHVVVVVATVGFEVVVMSP